MSAPSAASTSTVVQKAKVRGGIKSSKDLVLGSVRSLVLRGSVRSPVRVSRAGNRVQSQSRSTKVHINIIKRTHLMVVVKIIKAFR